MWRLPLGSRGTPEPLPISGGNQASPSFSPDGRWLAYASSESGRFDVFVQPYPALNHKTQVSVGGGSVPQWSADGRRLYYRRPPHMMAVPVSGTDSLSIGAPSIVFERADVRGSQLLPDGSFIALQNRDDAGDITELKLIVNWLDELKRLAPPSR